MKNVVIALALVCSSGFLSAQCDQVLFTGKVMDTLRPNNFYNLMVINRTTGRGVFGQPNGTFSVYASEGDSISLSITGYPAVHTRVVADSNCQFKRILIIEGNPQELDPVVVRPLKSLQEIKEERQALAMRETRTVTGVEMLQSPITALYQAFSKKERTKRWIAEQEYKDNQAGVLRDLLRTYVAYDVIELNDEEFEEFIYFLNMDEQFLKTASEMELITFIQDKFEHYKLIKKNNPTGEGKTTVFDRLEQRN
ncbi:MAG: hypothetical protein HWE22_16280 [Flavobacteriales bacterium]|nr:hypothetical protein [Flavobacteriales bacterium]